MRWGRGETRMIYPMDRGLEEKREIIKNLIKGRKSMVTLSKEDVYDIIDRLTESQVIDGNDHEEVIRMLESKVKLR